MKKKYKIFAAPAFLAAAIAGVLIAGTIPGIPGVFTSTVHAEGEGESGSDYDNEYNMLSDEGYKDFSLDITDPAEFTSDDHPLESTVMALCGHHEPLHQYVQQRRLCGL